MTVKYYQWGQTTPEGIYINEIVYTDIFQLKFLIETLKMHNLTFLGMNKQGIIINDELYEIGNKIENNLINLSELTTKVTNIEDIIQEHELRIKNLYEKSPLPVDPVEDVKKYKNVTGEFYLLYGSLPEEFKKKLKIYIKND